MSVHTAKKKREEEIKKQMEEMLAQLDSQLEQKVMEITTQKSLLTKVSNSFYMPTYWNVNRAYSLVMSSLLSAIASVSLRKDNCPKYKNHNFNSFP